MIVSQLENLPGRLISFNGSIPAVWSGPLSWPEIDASAGFNLTFPDNAEISEVFSSQFSGSTTELSASSVPALTVLLVQFGLVSLAFLVDSAACETLVEMPRQMVATVLFPKHKIEKKSLY